MSQSLQYILVYIILIAVIGWIIYRLVHRGSKDDSSCSCCSKSSGCIKKQILEKERRRQSFCEHCSEADENKTDVKSRE